MDLEYQYLISIESILSNIRNNRDGTVYNNNDNNRPQYNNSKKNFNNNGWNYNNNKFNQ